jgi:hypothetical protein
MNLRLLTAETNLEVGLHSLPVSNRIEVGLHSLQVSNRKTTVIKSETLLNHFAENSLSF